VPRLLPSTLGRMTIRQWAFPRHLRLLEAACLRLVDDPARSRLLVEMPVRHGKSWYCSHVLPAWYLLTRPSRQLILATYGRDFSSEWTGKVKDTVLDYGPRLTGVTLGSVKRKDHTTFVNVARGGVKGGALRTASPGTKIAGKGAHLIVCDDLVSDWREAASPARRRSLTTWVDSELFSRLEPDGKVLAVMSCRHPDDQSARWKAQNADLPPHLRWEVLRMPALGEDGAALWPERWPVGKLLEKKRGYELDGLSYLWDCLWQQDPRGDSSLVEWPDAYFAGVGYDDLPPGLPVRFRLLSLDPSKGSDSRTGDYSAWADVTADARGGLWCEPHLAVMPAEQVEDYTVELLARNHYHALVVECNGFQELIADNVVRKCQARGVPCPMHRRVSTENKEVRIRLGLGPLLAQGRVRLCARGPGYRLALSQLREFPTAAHDDFPDSLTLALDLLGYLLSGRGQQQAATVYVPG
jgi:predicted phage terminase large subunit-like protein